MINSLEKLEIVKDRGESAQILGGWPSPPSAAKCVRTNSRILHQYFSSGGRDGTGRRVGFRILWGNPCGFDSLRPHQYVVLGSDPFLRT